MNPVRVALCLPALPALAGRPTLKDNQAWERAEVELLAAELDAALPPPGQ